MAQQLIMEQYRVRKRKILLMILVLIALMISVMIVGAFSINKLGTDSKIKSNMSNKALSQLNCFELCYDFPFAKETMCCKVDGETCKAKQQCKTDRLRQLEHKIDSDNDIIILEMIGFFLLIGLLALNLTYFCILKRRARIEREREQREQTRIREGLLQNQDGNVNINEILDMEIETFEQLVQFLIQNGYIQGRRRPPRGDPRISDSFGTEDENSCSICLDTLSTEKVIDLPCTHRFHSSCIRQWCVNTANCPVCRSDIYANEPDQGQIQEVE